MKYLQAWPGCPAVSHPRGRWEGACLVRVEGPVDPGRLQRSGGFRGEVLGRSWRSRGGTRASTKQFPARVQGDSRKALQRGLPRMPRAGRCGAQRLQPLSPWRGDLDSTFAPGAPKTGAGSRGFTNSPLPGLARSLAESTGIPTVPLGRLPPSDFLPAGGSWSPKPSSCPLCPAHPRETGTKRAAPPRLPGRQSRAGSGGGGRGGGGSRAQGCSSPSPGTGQKRRPL